MKMVIKALICGGGHGAHVMAGTAASQTDVEAYVLTLFANEAERWTKVMENNEFTVSSEIEGRGRVVTSSKPKMVVKDPVLVAPQCDIIIFVVPAFAHADYLKALKPHVKPGVILAGLPGQAGFEFAVRGIWDELARKCTIMSFESLPWACRILQFGRSVEVLGTKETLLGAIQPGSIKPQMDPTEMLQQVLGPQPKLQPQGHLLGVTLMSTNAYLHPCIMYGRWSDWDDKAVDEEPLFYHGIDQPSADILFNVSDEVIAIAKAIMTSRPTVDLSAVVHIYQWYLRCYCDQIEDKTNLHTAISTNKAYNGLAHPMKEIEPQKFVPNFSHRYMAEDIPFGLAVIRDIATIAGVVTPYMDTVINWAQGKMGKEYLVDGELKGKDMKFTRSAQSCGIKDMDSMLGFEQTEKLI